VPSSCTTDYVDDVPSIIVGFPNADDAEKWMQPFYEQVGGPFCDAANRHGREARIYLTIGAGEAQRARRYSCEFGKWGDWFETGPANAPASERASASEPAPASEPAAPVETIAEAVRACNAVQADRSIPVSCSTRYVNGLPSMIVGFGTRADVDTYLQQIAGQIAGPFCDAANRLGRRASLYVTVAESRARHFDCARQEWGEWFELPGQEESAPTLIPG